MPDTPASDTPLTPELRVEVRVPLPAEPFAQARILALLQPIIEATTDSIAKAVGDDFTVDSRVVKPKPPGKPKAAPLAAVALLLLAACGVATTEPDCLREGPGVCQVVEDDGGAGDDGDIVVETLPGGRALP